MRVGINSGQVLAGAIGSDLKLEYTAIGETANLANRMEANCKIGQMLIAENTKLLIRDIRFEGIEVDQQPEQFNVKGYQEPVDAFNIYPTPVRIEKNLNFTNNQDFYLY